LEAAKWSLKCFFAAKKLFYLTKQKVEKEAEKIWQINQKNICLFHTVDVNVAGEVVDVANAVVNVAAVVVDVAGEVVTAQPKACTIKLFTIVNVNQRPML
jgi:hypothetical protein